MIRKLEQLILAVVTLVVAAGAQIINVNPDKSAPPWIAGDVPPLSAKDKARISAMPHFARDPRNCATLPASADNSTTKYFRPIFNQTGSSCAQASGIGYVLTYEVNKLLDRDGSISDNQFAPHFTWDFINGAADQGSWPWQGWDIVEQIGCANMTDFGGEDGGDPTWTKWMSGFDQYKRSAPYNITSMTTINNLNTATGLANLKQYLVDGHIVSFSANSSGYTMYTIGYPYHNGEHVITKWGTGGAHMMTFVGYDDSIKIYDSANSAVETGALKVANSWGTWFGDSGFCWLSYADFNYNTQDNGGVDQAQVYGIAVEGTRSITQTVKMEIQENSRFELTFNLGVSQDTNATSPSFSKQLLIGKPANDSAGAPMNVVPMQGLGNYNPIDFEFTIADLTSKIDASKPYKVFLTVDRAGAKDSGQIDLFALTDNADAGKTWAWKSGSQVNTLNGIGTTTLTIIKSGNPATDYLGPVVVGMNGLFAFMGDSMKPVIKVIEPSGVKSAVMTYVLPGGTVTSVPTIITAGTGDTVLISAAIPCPADTVTGSFDLTMSDNLGNVSYLKQVPITWGYDKSVFYIDQGGTWTGTGSADTVIAAIKLGAQEIGQFYNGGMISGMKFPRITTYDNYVNPVSAVVYRGPKNGSPTEQMVDMDVKSLVDASGWTTCTFSTPVALDSDHDYWVGYRIGWSSGAWPLELVEGTPIEGKSNVIFIGGQWTTLTQNTALGRNGSWPITAFISSPNSMKYPRFVSISAPITLPSDAMTLTAKLRCATSISSVTANVSINKCPASQISLASAGTDPSDPSVSLFTASIPAPGRSALGMITATANTSGGYVTNSVPTQVVWLPALQIGFDNDSAPDFSDLGNAAGDAFSPTVRLGSDKLGSLTGDYITGIMFYLNDASSSGRITALNAKVYSSPSGSSANPVTVDSANILSDISNYSCWEYYMIPDANIIPITAGMDYLPGYDITFSGGYWCSYSDMSGASANEHLVYYRGAWTDVSTWNSSFGNTAWNIRALVESNPKNSIVKTRLASVNSCRIAGNKTGELRFIVNLTNPGTAKISIFNLSGRLVRTLNAGAVSSGIHSFSLSGPQLSAGMYLYRFECDGFRAVDRFTITH